MHGLRPTLTRKREQPVQTQKKPERVRLGGFGLGGYF